MSRDPRFPPDLQDYLRGAARTAGANPHIEGDIFDRALDNITMGRVGTVQERDLLTGEPVGETDAEDGEETEAESEVTPGNVRTTGEGRDEEEETNPCEVKRYGSLNCPGGDDERHHIVPDTALRYGTREEGRVGVNRIDGMPSLRDGMAICVDGRAKVPGTEHNIGHSVTDPMIQAAGAAAPIPGTTTLRTAMDAGIAGAATARPECVDEITAAVEAQFGPIGGNRLVNATGAPATGAARDALIAGQ